MSNKELLETIDVIEEKLETLRSIQKIAETNNDIKKESKAYNEYKRCLKLRSELVNKILSDDILTPVIENCEEKTKEEHHYNIGFKDSMIFLKAVDYKLEELYDIETDYEFKREYEKVEETKKEYEKFLRVKNVLADEIINSKELERYLEKCKDTKDVVTPEKAIRYRYLMHHLNNN